MSANGTLNQPRSSGHSPASFHAPAPVRRVWRERVRVWWRELDKVLLVLVILLMLIGTAAVTAASPASAERLSSATKQLDDLMFLKRHVVFQLAGLAIMIGLSFMTREEARRVGIVLGVIMFALMLLVPVIGPLKNGSRRWIEVGISLQPSEFLKPAFAIIIAWIMSWRVRDPNLPVTGYSLLAMVLVAALMMMQPDLGGTILFAGIWFVIVLLSGVSLHRIAMLGLIGAVVGMTGAYFFYDNAQNRILSFISGGTEFDQVDLAFRTLVAGGWTGTGLWLGVRKMNLPEAHTDYIFSVIGEEFGLLICALVVLLYLAVVVRVLIRLVNEDNLFTLLAGAGLVAGFGGQAFINILVNLKMFPSKGMTLPLISYGGSSTLAVCVAIGLLLAITRRNPFLEREAGGLRSMFERSPADRAKPQLREERA